MGKKHLITAEAEGDQCSLWGETWRRFRKNRLTMVSIYLILTLVIIVIATIIIDAATGKSIHPSYVVKQDLKGRLQGPSPTHPSGLDKLGRDVLLRILRAVWYSLLMEAIAIIISYILGGLLRALTGYYDKIADNVIMRIMGILLAIPSMLLAIAIMATLETGITNMLITIAISYVPIFTETVRVPVFTAEDQKFIEATRSVGYSDWRIIVKYMTPSPVVPTTVQMALGIAGVILSTARLSFLGLGIQPPAPE